MAIQYLSLKLLCSACGNHLPDGTPRIVSGRAVFCLVCVPQELRCTSKYGLLQCELHVDHPLEHAACVGKDLANNAVHELVWSNDETLGYSVACVPSADSSNMRCLSHPGVFLKGLGFEKCNFAHAYPHADTCDWCRRVHQLLQTGGPAHEQCKGKGHGAHCTSDYCF